MGMDDMNHPMSIQNKNIIPLTINIVPNNKYSNVTIKEINV